MKSLLKLANKIDFQLKRTAAHAVVTQINELLNAAYALFQFKPEIKKLLKSEDVYGEMAMKSLHGLLEGIYFGASALKQDALHKGLSASDMAARKKRISGLCDQVMQTLSHHGLGSEMWSRLGLTLVKAKADALVPMNLPPLQPKPSAPAPSQPAETGRSFRSLEHATPEQARAFYAPEDDDLPEEFKSVVRSLGPKTELQQAGIAEEDWDVGKADW